MHRAVCRVLRGTCRKFRENDSMSVVGEEVRQNRSKDDFSTKYTIPEALGWTTGIILTYEFTHRRRRFHCQLEETTNLTNLQLYFRRCPFAIAKHAIAQPTVATNSVRSIQETSPVHHVPACSTPNPTPTNRKSIDMTPFLAETEPIGFFNFPTPSTSKEKFLDYETDDDEGVHFDETISKFDEVRSTHKPRDSLAVSLAEKLTGDLFSALGTFKFLTGNKESMETTSKLDKLPISQYPSPPMNAFELLEKGIELGSSRALYNIGVAYDRMNDTNLAQYYYTRAAEVGHPLAAYNVGVFALKDGKTNEGKKFMEFAAEKGVAEAKDILKDLK